MTPSAASARILLIEDEAPIRRFLKIALGSAGHETLEAGSGREGLEQAVICNPDLIILDLGLPDMDGKAVVREIRSWSSLPILVLSVRDGEAEKIAALDAGADDYVTKPFATGELLARLRVLLRKRGDSEAQPSTVQVGPLSVDLARRLVTVGEQEIKLTRKEFDILALLARHGGRLVSHRQILTEVWGPAHVDDLHYLRIAIGHIRNKLDDDPASPRFIVTEPGVGYRLLS
jgi:two-component system KDP operon response regulator KdpE